MVRGPRTPIVSTAIGKKRCSGVRLTYLATFLSSASAATAPASLVVWAEYEGAKASWHVMLQMRSFLLLQGTTTIPSGCSSSARCRPDSSKRDGTLAEGSLHNVIHLSMSVMATFTPSTAQSMCGKIVHLLPTVDAGVGSTQESTQLKACGHSDGVVIHAQPQCQNGQNVEPCSRLPGC